MKIRYRFWGMVLFTSLAFSLSLGIYGLSYLYLENMTKEQRLLENIKTQATVVKDTSASLFSSKNLERVWDDISLEMDKMLMVNSKLEELEHSKDLNIEIDSVVDVL